MKDKNKSKSLLWLVKKTSGYRAKIIILMFMSAISAALSVAFALLCKRIIDLPTYNSERFLFSVLFVLSVLLISAFLDWAGGIITQKMKQNIVMSLRDELLSHILSGNYAEISKYHTGDLINRMLADVQLCAEGCADFIPSLVFMIVKFIFAAAALIVLAGKWVLIFAIGCAVAALLAILAKKKIQNLYRGVVERRAANQSFLQEALSCILSVKAFGAEERIKDEYYSRQKDFMDYRLKRWIFRSSAKAGLNTALSIAYLAAVVVGCFGISNNLFTLGSFVAILQLVSAVQAPFSEIPYFLSKYFTVLAGVERITQIEDIPTEKHDSFDREALYSEIKGIKVSDLCFSYTENEVLSSACAYFKKGEITALTGISGCGKSTFFLLMLGVYEPSSGGITFDFCEDCKGGRSENTGAYRKLFSYVPQGNNFFAGTIKDNITLFDKSVPDSKCIAALEISRAAEFVEKLPDGLYSRLSEKGAGLSAGQLQRLAIARAILSDAPVLLLDEATCSLDAETEKRVLENIKSLNDKTVIIVTHGEESLKICDCVYTLKDGKITKRE